MMLQAGKKKYELWFFSEGVTMAPGMYTINVSVPSQRVKSAVLRSETKKVSLTFCYVKEQSIFLLFMAIFMFLTSQLNASTLLK